MRAVDLVALYALIGTGCALVVLLRADSKRMAHALLMVPFWPLLGPFVLAELGRPAPRPQVGDHRLSAEFQAALAGAQGTPLAILLPDEPTARLLGDRVELAAQRVAEIERLLEQPAFSEDAALARHAELAALGQGTAASTALSRAQNIRRLVRLRDHWERELAAVGELCAQLRIQAEVVRLSGEAEVGSRDVVDELVARVEGLDAMLEEEDARAT